MKPLLNIKQLNCICAIMNKLNIKDQSCKDMVAGFSDGRTTSRGDLYSDEAKALIQHLKSLDPEEQKAEVMRRKIISLAHEMGWRVVKRVDNVMKAKADMVRIDGWCVNYSYLHKKLNQYQYAELPKLITQFEGVYKSYLAGVYK